MDADKGGANGQASNGHNQEQNRCMQTKMYPESKSNTQAFGQFRKAADNINKQTKQR